MLKNQVNSNFITVIFCSNKKTAYLCVIKITIEPAATDKRHKIMRYTIYIEGLSENKNLKANTLQEARKIAVEEAKEMAQKNDSYGDALYSIEKDSNVIKSSYVHYNRDNDKFSFYKPIWEK